MSLFTFLFPVKFVISFFYSVFRVQFGVLPKLNNAFRCVDLGASDCFLQSILLRKEVIQPHLPIRLPCYDFTPVITPALDGQTGFGREWLPWCDGRCVQGPGTYSPQYADLRLLAIPTSCRRVSACNPNWGQVSGSASLHRVASFCPVHCSTCVARGIRGMMT